MAAYGRFHSVRAERIQTRFQESGSFVHGFNQFAETSQQSYTILTSFTLQILCDSLQVHRNELRCVAIPLSIPDKIKRLVIKPNLFYNSDN